jgi:hypothetical protein
MTLSVAVTAGNEDTAGALRALVAKVGTLIGVIAAAEQPRTVPQSTMRLDPRQRVRA